MASSAPVSIGTWRAAAASAVGALSEGVQALVPARVRAWLERDPHDIVVTIDAAGGAGLVVANGVQPLGADCTADLRRLAGIGSSLTLQVPSSRALVRSLALPTAALSRLDDVLALDLERATPFKRSDVFAAHRVVERTAERATIKHVIVKASALNSVLAAAATAGLPVKAIRLADGPDADLNLLPRVRQQRARLTRALRTASLLTAGALLGLGLAVGGLAYWRLTTATAIAEGEQVRLTAAVATLRRETQEADRAVQEARYARMRRLEQPMVTALWEDLSQRLPNNTWLTDMRIDETAIVIEGHSANAADLVALLARSPSFSSATFAAPITRDPQRSTERFQIRLVRASTSKGAP